MTVDLACEQHRLAPCMQCFSYLLTAGYAIASRIDS